MRRPRRSRAGAEPEISVVIPTRDRPRELRACLEGYARQTVGRARFQVVVVDDGSARALAPVAARFARHLRLDFVRQEHRGVAAARNAALARARAPLVVLGEDDIVPGPDLLRYCLDFHAERPDERDAVLLRFGPDVGLRRNALLHHLLVRGLWFQFPPHAGVFGWPFFWGGALSCKRSLFAHGTFDPSLRRMEDTELGLRLAQVPGLRVHYADFELARHVRAPEIRATLRREYEVEYHRRVVVERSGAPARALRGRGALAEPSAILGAADLAGLLASVDALEPLLASHDPRFVTGTDRDRLSMLLRLYDTLIAHAHASGWDDAGAARPCLLPLPGPLRPSGRPGARGLTSSPATAAAPTARAPLPAIVERTLRAAERRLGRAPAVLDLGTGLDLASRLPALTVVEPPRPLGPLPYLDRTIDVVFANARTAEAARVAGTAVVNLRTQRARWRTTRGPSAAAVTPPRPARLRPHARRALLVAPTFPDHDRASGSQRTFDQAALLRASGWHVTLAAERDRADSRYAQALRRVGVVPHLGWDPDLLTTQRFDVVLFAYWPTAERHTLLARRLSPRTRVVVDSVDLHFLRRSRQRFGSREALGWSDAAEAARELNAYAAADAVLAVSDKEAAFLAELVNGACLVRTAPDREDVPPASTPFAERQGLLFVGNFRHEPNREAVLRLCREILPRLSPALRRAHPLTIVGFGVDEEILALDRIAGVRVAGFVPALGPYLARARAMVAPLRHGAGTKRKLLQAFLSGLPVVTTSTGAEGFPLADGQGLRIVDDEGAFAKAVERVLTDEAEWTRLAGAARAPVRAVHGTEAARARLMGALEDVLARPARPPADARHDVGLGLTAEALRSEASAVSPADPVLDSRPAVSPDVRSRAPNGRADVVILAVNDWHVSFARSQQLALAFGQHGRRVFYVQPGSAGVERGFSQVAPGVTVVSLGVDHDALERTGLGPEDVADALAGLERLRAAFGVHEAVLKVEFPTWAPIAIEAGRRFAWPLVYDHMEDHRDVQWQRPASLPADTMALARASALVLAASPLLRRSLRGTPRVALFPNAADVAHFREPLAPPAELARRPRPIVGYFGIVTDWFDVALVAAAARKRPAWTFVIVGPVVDVDVARLSRLPNVVLAGEQPYRELPGWARLFDVGLIPHRLRARTHRAGSVKFFEYLAAGLPVVATALDWARPYARQGLLRLARTPAGLVRAVESALRADGETARRRRRAFADRNSWEARARELGPALDATFPLASVVVVAWNNLECTRRCLDSVRSRTGWGRYEIVVVDNGSRDGTGAYLRALARQDARVRVVSNRGNRGFAPAANQGLRAARGEVLVLLNNDTVVTAGWLGGLAAHLRDPAVGAVGPVTNWASGVSRVEVGYASLAGMEAWARGFTAAHARDVREVEQLAMFCYALRRDVLEEVGPLDERFEVGMFEDDDYARRIRATGRRLLCAADVFVHHVGHASFTLLGGDAYDRAFRANRERYEEKWRTRWVTPAGRADG